MAHTITKTVLQNLTNGHRSIFHITFISDGVTADLTDYVLVDPVVDLGLTPSARLAVEDVEFSFINFDGALNFDTGLADKHMIWALSRELRANHFVQYSGIKDPNDPAGSGTGKIMINTFGLDTAGSLGSLILKVRNS